MYDGCRSIFARSFCVRVYLKFILVVGISPIMLQTACCYAVMTSEISLVHKEKSRSKGLLKGCDMCDLVSLIV